jgi:hypothetical protein
MQLFGPFRETALGVARLFRFLCKPALGVARTLAALLGT